MSDVDVVVVSYNSADHLRECVTSLSDEPGVHVYVADSASSDDCLATIADLPVTTIPLTENRGFAHGCNVGWRRGSSPYVLFLNPDATLDRASLDGMVAAAAGSSDIGIVAPRIEEPDGTLDFSQRRFPRLRSTYAQALFLHRFWPYAKWTDEVERDPAAYERPGSPEWASGACLLVRRSVLERLDGLDEGFFLYCEDLDLCRRVRDAGFDIRFVPDGVAVHEGGQSAARSALLPVLAASRVRYGQLHQRPLVALLERGGIALGALTHALVSRGGLPARRGWLQALGRALSPRPRSGPA